eukprot:TRINITY_DN2255_c1_g1_i1.p1 TRINITY_DN2255_c1_g1~~TRINITY_DN2255_c1_g1_i1.p1  ORF type:complete len:631 (+),score=188.54 TRINITY_DN2255_c1_g1_i1:64-1956(+)
MGEPQAAASTLGLLNRHRQARELLAKSHTAGGVLWDENDVGLAGGGGSSSCAASPRFGNAASGGTSGGNGLPPRMTRPQSASNILGSRLSYQGSMAGAATAAANRPRSASHAQRSPSTQIPAAEAVAAARSHFVSGPSTAQSPQRSASNPALRRPVSACAASGRTSNSPASNGVFQPQAPFSKRPASAGGNTSVAAASGDWYCPQAASLLRPASASSSRPSGHPEGDGKSKIVSPSGGELPSQGPPLLSSKIVAAKGPAPPLPPLPPDLEVKSKASTTTVPAGSASYQDYDDAAFEESAGDDQNFTAEELRLENEVEEALSQLEAVDTAVQALKYQYELANEDIEESASELAQLKSAAESWVKAAEEGKVELRDREQRLEELIRVLPNADGMDLDGSEPAAVGPKREEADSRQAELAAQRVKVLNEQSERLLQQVESQQSFVAQKMEERRALERQVDALLHERDEQRAEQQEARAALRAVEGQLKSKEEALTLAAKRRQELEKQALRLRCEARGLRARLDAMSAESETAAANAPRTTEAMSAESETAASNAPKTTEDLPPEPEDLHNVPKGPPQGETRNARQVSLKLQHEIVNLWAQLKACDEKALAFQKKLYPEELNQLNESLNPQDRA